MCSPRGRGSAASSPRPVRPGRGSRRDRGRARGRPRGSRRSCGNHRASRPEGAAPRIQRTRLITTFSPWRHDWRAAGLQGSAQQVGRRGGRQADPERWCLLGEHALERDCTVGCPTPTVGQDAIHRGGEGDRIDAHAVLDLHRVGEQRSTAGRPETTRRAYEPPGRHGCLGRRSRRGLGVRSRRCGGC